MPDAGFDPSWRWQSGSFSQLPIAAWGDAIGIAVGSTSATNAEALGEAADFCTLVAIGGAVWWAQGDVTVEAVAEPPAHYLPADTPIEITTVSAKYIAVIAAAGSAASQLVISPRR